MSPKKSQSKILVATDFSRPARRAFLYAISLASTLNVGMVILNVINPLPGSGYDSPVSNRYLDPLKTEALLDLGRLARIALEPGNSAEPQLAYGQPALSILEKAKKIMPG